MTAWVAGFSALTGLFGSTAYWVAQRTRELAVRQALGAGRGDILRLVLGRAARLAGAGAVLGLAVAALVARTLPALLHDVEPLDPASYALAALAVVAAALLAGAVPAVCASHAAPAATLRRS